MTLHQKRMAIQHLVDQGTVSMKPTQIGQLTEATCDMILSRHKVVTPPPTAEAQLADILADTSKSGASETTKRDETTQAKGTGSSSSPDDLEKRVAKILKPRLIPDTPPVEERLNDLLATRADMENVAEWIDQAQGQFQQNSGRLDSYHNQLMELAQRIGKLRDELKKEVEALVELQSSSMVLTIKSERATKVLPEGLRHRQFGEILRLMTCRTHDNFPLAVWLWGAAGGGKTTLAAQLAEALDVQPTIISMGPTYTEAKLLGYRNLATGEYVRGEIRQPYEEGGLVLMDEVDISDPGVLVSANALLANKSFLFPDGTTVERHHDFYVLGGANTMGTGSTGGYRRNTLDAATLDRFVPLELEYDQGLEKSLAGEHQSWAHYIHKVRAQLNSMMIPAIMGTRAIVFGAAQLANGISPGQVIERTLAKLPPDVATTIKSQVKYES